MYYANFNFFRTFIKEDGWRLPFDNTFLLWLPLLLLIYLYSTHLPKGIEPAYNKSHIYMGKIKCLSDYHITQKC